VVVADTIVVLGDSVLGKPRDVDEAEETLKRLAGRTHRVLTRYAVSVSPDSERVRVARTVESDVTIRAAAPAELRAYAETGEGLDKAGAYAAQGIGSFLVERISGSYTNVVGLPTCELVMDLRALGLLVAFPRKT
jgi:septum formation protein